MITAMTEDDVKDAEKRVAELTASPLLVERIASVLMDSRIGGTGLYEKTAKSKSDALMAIIEDFAASELERYKADVVGPLVKATSDVQSLLHFYGKREMEAPANNQEAVRDTRERLDAFDAALAAARKEK